MATQTKQGTHTHCTNLAIGLFFQVAALGAGRQASIHQDALAWSCQFWPSALSPGRVRDTISIRDENGKWSAVRAAAAYRDVQHSQKVLQSGNKWGLTGHGSQHFCHVFEVFYDTQGCRVMLAMEMADRTLLSDMRRYQQFAEDEVRLFIRGLLQAGLYCGTYCLFSAVYRQYHVPNQPQAAAHCRLITSWSPTHAMLIFD